MLLATAWSLKTGKRQSCVSKKEFYRTKTATLQIAQCNFLIFENLS